VRQQNQYTELRMSSLQQQDEDLSSPYPICCKATIPGASSDEYCDENVYQEIGYFSPLRWEWERDVRMDERKEYPSPEEL
jgi:hypothetical protein